METFLKTPERMIRPNSEPHSESILSTRDKSEDVLSDADRPIRRDDWKLRNLTDYISQIVCVFTPDGQGQYFNPYWESYTGLSDGQSLNAGWMRAFHREDVDVFARLLGRTLEPAGWECEPRLRRTSDGSYRRHLCRCSALPNQSDGPAALLICCTDIEDWRSAEATAKEQGALLGFSLRTHDEEKRKIAHGLHDSAGQYLVALQMKLDGLQRCSLGYTGRKNPIADECRELVKRCCREIRTLSHLLYPALLDDLGLESAVHLHVDGFVEQTKAAVEVSIEPNLGRLDRDLEIALFRVIQEALRAIHRQCGRKNLQIKIGAQPTSVFVEVAGWGATDSPRDKLIASSQTPSGAGMAILRQRILEVGGLFEIGSLAGGVAIRAVVPRRALVTQACD